MPFLLSTVPLIVSTTSVSYILHHPFLLPYTITHLCSPFAIFHPASCSTTSIIAVRRRSPSRRRRSQTLLLRPASHRSTPITTLWRRRPPPLPSQMALPFSPPLRWPGNWHVHRPSVHPVRTMSCLSTSSPLSHRSTTSRMGWGMGVTGSATAASSSRIWTCQYLWTFQTTANQTLPGQSPWGTCSHAAVASALMFSWMSLELGLVYALMDWDGLVWIGFESGCVCLRLDQFNPL